MENFKPSFNATVIDLLNESGMQLIGKCNMDQFGCGSFGTNSDFGEMYLVDDKQQKLCAGGSSGGSALAAVYGEVDL